VDARGLKVLHGWKGWELEGRIVHDLTASATAANNTPAATPAAAPGDLERGGSRCREGADA